MKILLLNPACYTDNAHITGISGCRWASLSPNTIDKKPLEKQKDCYYAIFPFPLAFTSTILKSQGHTTKVLDCIALNLTYAEMYEEIAKFNPEKIIYETSYVSLEQDLRIATNLRDFNKIEIVFVGSAVRGSKETIRKAGFSFVEGNYMKTISGSDNYVDLLTAPDRDDTVLMYNDYHSFGRYIPKPQLQIWTSIGCPYNCSFCNWRWTMTDGKYARRKIEHISAEIDDCVSRWGFKSCLIDDDTFNVGDKDTQAISKMLGKKKLPWSCMVRADSCSLETFKIMRDNGCISLKVGVETFSNEVLKTIGKGLEAESLLDRILQLSDMGFYLYLNCMQFIPGESQADRIKTKQILNQLYLLGVRFQQPMCLPLPGTKMGNEFKEWELKHYKQTIKDFDYGHFDISELTGRIVEYSNKAK